MPTWVCLLRAVNLGSHNKVSMPVLREALTDAGYADVRTYVQSGNVVVRTPTRSARKVAESVRAVVAERFDVDTPVVVRTADELAEVLDWNPFPEQAAAHPQKVYVVHLDTEPDPALVEALLAQDWDPDKVVVRGRDVVVTYGEGLHGSRLERSAAMRRITSGGTARNWRTLQACLDLARS
ncbi:MAG: DUF1697 domain-containing protein [Candidatus Nanopelagicales bacterium]